MQPRRHRAGPSLTVAPPSSEPRSRSGTHSKTQFVPSNSKPSTAALSLHGTSSEGSDKKTQAQVAFPKLTQYQGSKTSRWAGLNSQIAKTDLSEENQYRGPKINAMLEELLQYRSTLELALEREKGELITKILGLCEGILALYNISLNVLSTIKNDSLWELGPIHSKSELLKGFFALLPEICKFPYSFYTKIDLVSLTFCGTITLMKANNKRIVEGKLVQGIFPLGLFKNEESMIHHFYKVLIHHLRTETPDFEQRLIFEKVQDPKTMLATVMSFKMEQPKKPKEDDSLDESAKLLRNLISQPEKTLQNEVESLSVNARVMKDMLQSIDSNGINRKFWTQLGLNEPSVPSVFVNSE